MKAQGLDAGIGKQCRVAGVGGDEVTLGGNVAADDVGHGIRKAQVPQDLGSDGIVSDDTDTRGLPSFDRPDVAYIMQEGCDHLLLAAAVFASEMSRL